MKPSILLIDDNPSVLDELEAALATHIAGAAEIRKWIPKSEDQGKPEDIFAGFVDSTTRLVVTDHDLTAKGRTGLFGATVIRWCKQRTLPVADYSRGHVGGVPKEPSLFELRVPNGADAAARFVGSIFRGFETVREGIFGDANIKTARGPAAILAQMLGKPELETDLALYAARLSADATLLEMLVPGQSPPPELIAYIVGHMLLNSVLRFPGPIVRADAVLAYVACGTGAWPTIKDTFAPAKYSGPFGELDEFFWFAEVDDILADLQGAVDDSVETETAGELNRRALELKLGELPRPTCSRCNGVNGGFLCPFTRKTVCALRDCSVASNSWVPQGARLCRVEREFYDEWAPILGF